MSQKYPIFTLFIFSRILFLIFASLSPLLIPLRFGYLGSQFGERLPFLVWCWANFDGRHFLTIATQGYHNYNFVFFPFYPLLISFFARLLHIPELFAALIISCLAFFFALHLFVKLLSLDYPPRITRLALVFLVFAPTAFYFQAVYSESLFLLLLLLSFYFARKGHWIIAGFFGFFVTLTRHSGIALLPALLVEWLLQNRAHLSLRSFLKTCLPALLLSASGIFSFMLYTYFFQGDFLLFEKSFSAWGRNELTFPFQVFYRYLKIFLFVSPRLLVFWIAVLEFVSFLALSFLSLFTLFKVRVSYGVYMLTVLTLGSLSGTFLGTPRYLLHLFPAFLALSLLAAKHPRLKYSLLGLFFLLALILTSLFTRGYFVA